ncbi:MAG: hypothetical protein KGH72_00855 [Candidatus Micrarchaeota archaeon]|nr:hypothetical protein [Candidatus Micrarchaeota archaeon]
MRCFDVSEGQIEKGLSKRLGFEHIFTLGRDMGIGTNPGASRNTKFIIKSSDDGAVLRNMGMHNVVGIIMDQNKRQRSIIEKLASSEKLLFIVTKGITNSTTYARLREIQNARKLVSLAHMYGAGVALVSLASSNEELVSSMQMFEIAKFIGLSDANARHAVEAMAVHYDKKNKE